MLTFLSELFFMDFPDYLRLIRKILLLVYWMFFFSMLAARVFRDFLLNY